MRCVSNHGSLISIDAKEFLKILKRDYGTWSKIGEFAYEKDINTKKKLRDKLGIIKEINIPSTFIVEDAKIKEENKSEDKSKSPTKDDGTNKNEKADIKVEIKT